MGFSISYQATKRISPTRQQEIMDAADQLTTGRTWLSCEPLILQDFQGCFGGSSKPNFMPHPLDIASARLERLPDGTVNHLIAALCTLSKQFDIDWEISHDHSDGTLGYIRSGKCDATVRSTIRTLAFVSSLILWVISVRQRWWLLLIPLGILIWLRTR